jgi:hypothetical protein
MANLQKGIKKSEERAEENKGAGFYRVKTLFMKDGEGPWFLRFVTDLDEMVIADMHMFCDTKAKPEEYKGDNWPAGMPAVCMNDRMYRIPDGDGNETDEYEPGYGDCYIHNRDRGKVRDGKFKKDKSVPDNQTFALAVVREAIPDPVTKRPKGFRDVMEEFKKEDETLVKVPRFVIISQKHRNFWSGVEAAIYMGDAPVSAYDFRISRKENDYSFSVPPSGPDPVLHPGSEAWKRYTEALELVGFSLDDEILRMGSQDWYDRWFVEGAVPKDGYGRKDDDEEETAGGTPQEGTRPDPAQVDQFAEELKKARSKAAAEA